MGEYACRAGQRLPYSSGEKLDPLIANVGDFSGQLSIENSVAPWLNPVDSVGEEKALPAKIAMNNLANTTKFDGERPAFGTLPSGSLRPNAWGFYDMHGNVWEWVADAYGNYPTGTVRNPAVHREGATRVFRGGSWYVAPSYARSASRAHYKENIRRFNVGFRLAIDGVERH